MIGFRFRAWVVPMLQGPRGCQRDTDSHFKAYRQHAVASLVPLTSESTACPVTTWAARESYHSLGVPPGQLKLWHLSRAQCLTSSERYREIRQRSVTPRPIPPYAQLPTPPRHPN